MTGRKYNMPCGILMPGMVNSDQPDTVSITAPRSEDAVRVQQY